MKTFKFKVTVTDVYSDTITVQAKNKKEAEELVERDLDACPLETRRNCLEDSDTSFVLLTDRKAK